MSEWRHRPTMYDGSHPLRGQTCQFCGDSWPCDAERQRLQADRLERNLRQLVEDADTFELAARGMRVWNEKGPAETITRAIQKYRSVLGGGTE